MEYVILFIFGFVLSVLLTKPCLKLLYRLKIGQKILEDTPESHQKKAGTPTMGGIIFLLGCIICMIMTLLIDKNDYHILPAFVYPLFMGIVGSIDDYLTVHPKNGVRGIKSQPKALIQGIITVAFVCWLAFSQQKEFNILGLHLTGIWYVITVSFIITGFVNFTNLTDGLDGLLAGIVAVMGLVFLPSNVNLFMIHIFGGMCLGFLVTNSNPAKVFMGDTGSLFLGAMLMANAFLYDLEWIVFIASGWIILEGFSVIIQWSYFKITKKIYGEGRRVFLMAPIHHHFEKKGYPEQKITVNAWIITVILCMVAFIVGYLFYI